MVGRILVTFSDLSFYPSPPSLSFSQPYGESRNEDRVLTPVATQDPKVMVKVV